MAPDRKLVRKLFIKGLLNSFLLFGSRTYTVPSSMQRKLLFISLLLLPAIILNGCKPEIPRGALRFSHFWADSPQHRAAIDTLLNGFRKEHPEITLEVTELTWSDGKQKLQIGFNAETAPDVIELGSDWVPQFSSGGVLLNLGKVDTLASRFKDAPDYALEPGSWKGEYYAIPWIIDTRVMFVNDDLARAAGLDSGSYSLKNWDTMYALADAIEKSKKGHGIGINGADAHRLYKKFLPFIWSNGGRLFTPDGKPSLTLPQNVEALQYYVNLQKVGLVESQKALDDLFKRGQLGIWFSGSWMMEGLANAPFKWHLEGFPGHGGDRGVSFAGGEYLAINNKSLLKDEAIALVEYLTRGKQELSFAKNVNMYPAAVSEQSDPFYSSRVGGEVYTRQLQNALMTPVLPQWLDFEAIIEDEVSEALYAKKTPAEALASAQQRIEDIIHP